MAAVRAKGAREGLLRSSERLLFLLLVPFRLCEARASRQLERAALQPSWILRLQRSSLLVARCCQLAAVGWCCTSVVCFISDLLHIVTSHGGSTVTFRSIPLNALESTAAAAAAAAAGGLDAAAAASVRDETLTIQHELQLPRSSSCNRCGDLLFAAVTSPPAFIHHSTHLFLPPFAPFASAVVHSGDATSADDASAIRAAQQEHAAEWLRQACRVLQC